MRPIRFMATGWDKRQSKDCDNTHPVNRVLIPFSGGAEWSHRRADRAVPSDSHRHRGATGQVSHWRCSPVPIPRPEPSISRCHHHPTAPMMGRPGTAGPAGGTASIGEPAVPARDDHRSRPSDPWNFIARGPSLNLNGESTLDAVVDISAEMSDSFVANAGSSETIRTNASE